MFGFGRKYVPRMKREPQIVIATALPVDPEDDRFVELLPLPEDSEQYRDVRRRLEDPSVWPYVEAHELLREHLFGEQPLVIALGCEKTGLLDNAWLLDGKGDGEYQWHGALGFETPDDMLLRHGFEDVFGHEIARLWLYNLNYDPQCSMTNRSVTPYSIVDPYAAFYHGFMWCQDVLAAELAESQMPEESWSYRQARHAAGFDGHFTLREREVMRNNGFLYLTAEPDEADYPDYAALHAAHNASASVLYERAKTASQVLASPGAAVTFFYRLCSGAQKACVSREWLEDIGIEDEEFSPVAGALIRVLCAMKEIDMEKESLLPDFAAAYMKMFPAERRSVADAFADTTLLLTVDPRAQQRLGEEYRDAFDPDLGKALKNSYERQLKWGMLRRELYSRPEMMNAAALPSVWIEGSKAIRNDSPYMYPLLFDANCGTAIDFYSVEGLTLQQCRELVKLRDETGGFANEAAFYAAVEKIKEQSPGA